MDIDDERTGEAEKVVLTSTTDIIIHDRKQHVMDAIDDPDLVNNKMDKQKRICKQPDEAKVSKIYKIVSGPIYE